MQKIWNVDRRSQEESIIVLREVKVSQYFDTPKNQSSEELGTKLKAILLQKDYLKIRAREFGELVGTIFQQSIKIIGVLPKEYYWKSISIYL